MADDPRSVRELTQRIAKLESQVKALAHGRQIAYSSVTVDNGDGTTTDMTIPDAINAGVLAQQIAQTVGGAQQQLSNAQATLDQKLSQAQQDIAARPTAPVGDDSIGSVGLDKLIVGTAEMSEAVIDQLYANVITAKLLLAQSVITSGMIADTITGKIINGGTINGVVINGGDFITAADQNGFVAEMVSGAVYLASGGLAEMQILPSGITVWNNSQHSSVGVRLNASALNLGGRKIVDANMGFFSTQQTINPLGTVQVQHTVTFPSGRFSAAPAVAVTPHTQVGFNVEYGNASIGTSSMTFWAHRTDTSTLTTFSIIAVQTD